MDIPRNKYTNHKELLLQVQLNTSSCEFPRESKLYVIDEPPPSSGSHADLVLDNHQVQLYIVSRWFHSSPVPTLNIPAIILGCYYYIYSISISFLFYCYILMAYIQVTVGADKLLMHYATYII